MKNSAFPYQLLDGLRVTVIGLGVHGGGPGTVIWLMRHGAHVLVSDRADARSLREPIAQIRSAYRNRTDGSGWHLPVFHLDQIAHRTEDIQQADWIILNPAIARDSKVYSDIQRFHKPYRIADTSLFVERTQLPIVGITGTRGKTSTATLTGQLLRQRYPRTIVSGNIGSSPLLLVPEPWWNPVRTKKERLGARSVRQPIVVLELSSWQSEGLEQIRRSPQISVCTTLYPEHLNRYKSVAQYYHAKSFLFRYQRPGDIAILNHDQSAVRSLQRLTQGNVIWISQKPLLPHQSGAYADHGWLWIKEKQRKPQRLIQREAIPILGDHQTINILAAIVIARVLGLARKEIITALHTVRGVSGRLEHVLTRRGVSYYNDTAATSPEATIAALHALPVKRDIILIAGGADKGLRYTQCAQEITKRVREVILFSGPGSDALEHALHASKKRTARKPRITTGVSNMISAVKKAVRVARPTDIVLLSPTAASFGLFRHAEDRGQQFIRAVRKV